MDTTRAFFRVSSFRAIYGEGDLETIKNGWRKRINNAGRGAGNDKKRLIETPGNERKLETIDKRNVGNEKNGLETL